MSLPTGHREHRTALVIDVRKGVSADFEERYHRLLDSLNGDNIKVDVYTLSQNLSSGALLQVGDPDNAGSESPEPEIDLAAWASDEGYTQLLLSVSV